MTKHPAQRIRFFRLLPAILLFVASPHHAMAQGAGSAADLSGLWKAKKRFGPDARGRLVIERSGAAYRADMVGHIVPVSTANGELRFVLPNGEGSFRGRLDGNGIISTFEIGGHGGVQGDAVRDSFRVIAEDE